jgi:myo-inositol-1(or 4)-monophosphatase
MLKLVALFADDVHTVRAIGSAAMALAWIAAGRLEGYLNMSLGPWDVAAGELLIEEAGGALAGMGGGRWDAADSTCVASNGRLHATLLGLARQTDPGRS